MELKKSDWYETKSKIHIEMTYGQLKQQMRSLFRNLGDFVYYSFTLENDGKIKLIDFLKKIGINSQLQKDGKTIKIDLNKHHNFFEEQFAVLMDFNKCSICNKYIYSPVRTLFRDCPYHNPNQYGETFIHQGEPICDNCFAPSKTMEKPIKRHTGTLGKTGTSRMEKNRWKVCGFKWN